MLLFSRLSPFLMQLFKEVFVLFQRIFSPWVLKMSDLLNTAFLESFTSCGLEGRYNIQISPPKLVVNNPQLYKRLPDP